MPYIVENLAIKGTYLTQDAAIEATTLYVRDGTTNFENGAATIWDDDNEEAIVITARTSTTLTITGLGPLGGLVNAYTMARVSLVRQSMLAISDRVEFDIPIKSKWCKLIAIKIIQLVAGPMEISFEIWEEVPIGEGVRTEMHKNVIRRNIVLTAIEGGWYGESLANNPIPYKDREDPGEEYLYNLHCALVNEVGGTVSDFAVSIKLADIGELI